MSGAAILRAARAAGLDLTVDGDGLVLQAHAPPPLEILDALARHKQEIIDLLRLGRDGWSTEDWQAYFDERASIAEFDGGFDRTNAELIAFEDCIERWLIGNPPTVTDPDICIYCGLPITAAAGSRVSIPGEFGHFGALHTDCASRWQNQRRWRARRTLIWLIQSQQTLGTADAPDT